MEIAYRRHHHSTVTIGFCP